MSIASVAIPSWWLLKRSNAAVGRAGRLCIVTTAVTLATLGKIYWDPLQYVWPIGAMGKPVPIVAQAAAAPAPAAPILPTAVLAPLALTSPMGWATAAVVAPPAPPHHVSHPIAKPLPHVPPAPQGPLSWLSGLTAPRAR